jgi:diadenosine tetraphosphate (Ap4A) HIT family hydrolase
MMNCDGCRRVAGGNQNFIYGFKNSVLLLGDHQYFPGYSVLWLKQHLRELHELDTATAAELMLELRLASAAVAAASSAWKINIASLGNQVGHLHWHIFPRQQAEKDHLLQPWLNETAFAGSPGTAQERQDWILRIRQRLAL